MKPPKTIYLIKVDLEKIQAGAFKGCFSFFKPLNDSKKQIEYKLNESIKPIGKNCICGKHCSRIERNNYCPHCGVQLDWN